MGMGMGMGGFVMVGVGVGVGVEDLLGEFVKEEDREGVHQSWQPEQYLEYRNRQQACTERGRSVREKSCDIKSERRIGEGNIHAVVFREFGQLIIVFLQIENHAVEHPTVVEGKSVRERRPKADNCAEEQRGKKQKCRPIQFAVHVCLTVS